MLNSAGTSLTLPLDLAPSIQPPILASSNVSTWVAPATCSAGLLSSALCKPLSSPRPPLSPRKPHRPHRRHRRPANPTSSAAKTHLHPYQSGEGNPSRQPQYGGRSMLTVSLRPATAFGECDAIYLSKVTAVAKRPQQNPDGQRRQRLRYRLRRQSRRGPTSSPPALSLPHTVARLRPPRSASTARTSTSSTTSG